MGFAETWVCRVVLWSIKRRPNPSKHQNQAPSLYVPLQSFSRLTAAHDLQQPQCPLLGQSATAMTSNPYSLHVLYKHSAAHPTITTVAILGASLCIFLWFNRRQRRRSKHFLRHAKFLPDALGETPATIRTGTAANPAPKKRLPAQEKKEAKTKKRLARKEADAEAAAAAAVVASPAPKLKPPPTSTGPSKRSHESATSAQRSEGTITQKHVHPSASRSDIKVRLQCGPIRTSRFVVLIGVLIWA